MDSGIEHRVWDSEDRVWLPLGRIVVDNYGNALLLGEEANEPDEEGRVVFPASLLSPGERFVICRYTGFKGKNGIEIFQHDILECDHRTADYLTYARVAWDEEEGLWSAERMDAGECEVSSLAFLLADFDLTSVAGNVFENPELLEVRSE